MGCPSTKIRWQQRAVLLGEVFRLSSLEVAGVSSFPSVLRKLGGVRLDIILGEKPEHSDQKVSS